MAVRDIKIKPDSAIAVQHAVLALDAVIAVSQTDRRVAIIKPGHEFLLLPPDLYARVYATLLDFSITVVNTNGLVGIVDATLAIHSTPDQFAVGAFNYVIGGIGYSKAAATALEFSQAFTITNNKWGVSLVQINAAGTISTKEPSAAMEYDSAALALLAMPTPDTGNIKIGHWVIGPTGGTFTANTTALTTIGTPTDTAPITPAITSLSPVAGSVVRGDTPTMALGHGNSDAIIVVQYTTDGTGDITDGWLDVRYRPFPLNGEYSIVST